MSSHKRAVCAGLVVLTLGGAAIAQEATDVSPSSKAAADAYARARWMQVLKDRQIDSSTLGSFCSGTAVNPDLCKGLVPPPAPPPAQAVEAPLVVEQPTVRVSLVAIIGSKADFAAVFEVRRNVEPVERLVLSPQPGRPAALPDGRAVTAIETSPVVCVVFRNPSGRECRE